MRTIRKHSSRTTFNGRELRTLVLLAILMVIALLYGLYIGWWSLHKEEVKESSAFYSLFHTVLPSH
jgi:hypothetical protein